MNEKRYIRKPEADQRLRHGDKLLEYDAWLDNHFERLNLAPISVDPYNQEPGITNDSQDQSDDEQ